MGSADGNIFDCTKSTQAINCAQGIEPGTNRCDCLVQECDPLSKLLLDQRTPCVTVCESPDTWATICSSDDYARTADRCNWFGSWLCIQDFDSDDCVKPAMRQGSCEERCYSDIQSGYIEGAEKRLRMFLSCYELCAAPREPSESIVV